MLIYRNEINMKAWDIHMSIYLYNVYASTQI